MQCINCVLFSSITIRYFRSLIKTDFPDFCTFAKRFGNLTLELCLKFVAEHFFGHMHQRGDSPSAQHGVDPPFVLFFGVDELIKHPSYGDVIAAVGRTMDTVWTLFSQRHRPGHLMVLPLVTSLSSIAVIDSLTPSGRRLAWVPLGPLYGAAEHIASLEPRILAAGASVHKALRILCADLGEHGRMLEMLYTSLQENKGRRLRKLLTHGTGAISKILEDLEDPCDDYLRIPPDIVGLGIVTDALLGREVSRSQTPVGCGRTHDQLQVHGIYISSADESSSKSSRFTPMMSPFQLLHWAKHVKAGQESSDLVSRVADVLERVMARDSTVDGYTFENFACGTRCL
jgi:hypothetical protein